MTEPDGHDDDLDGGEAGEGENVPAIEELKKQLQDATEDDDLKRLQTAIKDHPDSQTESTLLDDARALLKRLQAEPNTRATKHMTDVVAALEAKHEPKAPTTSEREAARLLRTAVDQVLQDALRAEIRDTDDTLGWMRAQLRGGNATKGGRPLKRTPIPGHATSEHDLFGEMMAGVGDDAQKHEEMRRERVARIVTVQVLAKLRGDPRLRVLAAKCPKLLIEGHSFVDPFVRGSISQPVRLARQVAHAVIGELDKVTALFARVRDGEHPALVELRTRTTGFGESGNIDGISAIAKAIVAACGMAPTDTKRLRSKSSGRSRARKNKRQTHVR